jgi:hypothetical protein
MGGSSCKSGGSWFLLNRSQGARNRPPSGSTVAQLWRTGSRAGASGLPLLLMEGRGRRLIGTSGSAQSQPAVKPGSEYPPVAGDAGKVGPDERI